jgi:RalA-binding protein 1
VSPAAYSPRRFDAAIPASAPLQRLPTPYSPTSPVDEPRSPREKLDDLIAAEKAYYRSDSSGKTTPEDIASGLVLHRDPPPRPPQNRAAGSGLLT